MELNEISHKIIGKAIEVHKALGPGLLESSYEHCLMYELEKAGLKVKRQLGMPLVYKEVELDHGYKLDLLVEDQVVVELKTVEALHEVHEAQVLTYMKIGGYPLGLVINFNVKLLKDGIRRFKL